MPPAGTLRPQRGQPKVDLGKSLAVLVEVGQRKGRAQPLVILFQSAITHLRKSKHALKDAGRPRGGGVCCCTRTVLRPNCFGA